MAEEVPNQVILWALPVSILLGSEATSVSTGCLPWAQCSFSYVTPELAVQAEKFFFVLLDEMPESGMHARGACGCGIGWW